MAELTKKEVEEMMSKKITINISSRELFLLFIILSVLMYSCYLTGYITRSAKAQSEMLNVLGWWKIQRDCGLCEDWTCKSTICALEKFNLTALP